MASRPTSRLSLRWVAVLLSAIAGSSTALGLLAVPAFGSIAVMPVFAGSVIAVVLFLVTDSRREIGAEIGIASALACGVLVGLGLVIPQSWWPELGKHRAISQVLLGGILLFWGFRFSRWRRRTRRSSIALRAACVGLVQLGVAFLAVFFILVFDAVGVAETAAILFLPFVLGSPLVGAVLVQSAYHEKIEPEALVIGSGTLVLYLAALTSAYTGFGHEPLAIALSVGPLACAASYAGGAIGLHLRIRPAAAPIPSATARER